MMKRNYLLTLALSALLFNTRAQSHYPGDHTDKYLIKDTLVPAVYAFDLNKVRLLDSRFKDNMNREDKWIMSISANSLLHSFRTNAGVYSGVEGGYTSIKKLAGWESLDCELRGHTTGHILSALAMLYASTGEQKYKQKADSLVSGLAVVQKALNQGGYLSAFPQELINRNLNGQNVWAPWYTLHKILAGLIDQYLYCDNQQALEVAKGMATWAYQKLQPVSPAQRTIMLRNEFGGINECFYNLYAITGNEHDKWLGEFFYQNETLDPLKEGKDILNQKHANTYIPKLIGLTRAYEISGKGDYDRTAQFFWQTVVNHHTFATGSNSDKEHFFKPDELSKHLSGYTGESCNVYNMLKLTKHLYTHTMDVKYMDFYEKALYNHMLGQQDTHTGMVAYFLPMLPGAHKVYSTPDSSFWCCVGSGFESQAKYGESIYFHTNNAVVVNLFIPSVLNWNENNFSIKQETKFPENGEITLTILSASNKVNKLLVRYPAWATGAASVSINGKAVAIAHKPGSYISLSRNWKSGDEIKVKFDMQLHTIAANDNPDIQAVAYGPIVLAGELGTEGFVSPEPFSDPKKHNDYYTYNYHIPANINNNLYLNNSNINSYIQAVNNKPLTFVATKQNITLRPLYDIHQERYIVYWKILNTPQ